MHVLLLNLWRSERARSSRESSDGGASMWRWAESSRARRVVCRSLLGPAPSTPDLRPPTRLSPPLQDRLPAMSTPRPRKEVEYPSSWRNMIDAQFEEQHSEPLAASRLLPPARVRCPAEEAFQLADHPSPRSSSFPRPSRDRPRGVCQLHRTRLRAVRVSPVSPPLWQLARDRVRPLAHAPSADPTTPAHPTPGRSCSSCATSPSKTPRSGRRRPSSARSCQRRRRRCRCRTRPSSSSIGCSRPTRRRCSRALCRGTTPGRPRRGTTRASSRSSSARAARCSGGRTSGTGSSARPRRKRARARTRRRARTTRAQRTGGGPSPTGPSPCGRRISRPSGSGRPRPARRRERKVRLLVDASLALEMSLGC